MSLEVPTAQELYDAGKAEVQDVDPSLNLWTPGSSLDAVNGAGMVVADQTMAYMLRLVRSRFFATAVGQELDDLAWDVFKLLRKTVPQASVGLIYWTSALPTYTVPGGTVVFGTLDSGEIFEAITTEDASSDGNLEIPIAAVVPGRVGNVQAKTLDSHNYGPDPSAVVKQNARMAGGSEIETDDEFRARIQTYLDSLSKGNNAALLFAARLTPGVSSATLEEVPVGSGMVTYLYLADADGTGNAALVTRAETYVEPVRGSGTLLIMLGAARDERAVAVALTIEQDGDMAGAVAATGQVLTAWFDSVPAGVAVYGSKVESLCHGAHRDIRQAVADFVVLSPTERQDSIRLLGAASVTAVFE